MVEAVGNIYRIHQTHAKAMITSKVLGERPKILNENTIDFIEAKYQDILMDAFITGDLDKEYTGKAGFNPEEEVVTDVEGT
jgi:hypothetical protein